MFSEEALSSVVVHHRGSPATKILTVAVLTPRWIESVTADEIERFMLAELASIPREGDSATPHRLWSADMGEVDTEFLRGLTVQSREW